MSTPTARGARFVFTSLGFNSIEALSKLSGVHHVVLHNLLYTNTKCRYHVFARLYGVLVIAWNEHKDQLPDIDRAYIGTWLRRWSSLFVSHRIAVVGRKPTTRACIRAAGKKLKDRKKILLDIPIV